MAAPEPSPSFESGEYEIKRWDWPTEPPPEPEEDDALPIPLRRSIAAPRSRSDAWQRRFGSKPSEPLAGKFRIDRPVNRNAVESAFIAHDVVRGEDVLLRIMNDAAGATPPARLRAFEAAALATRGMRTVGAERVLECGVLPGGYRYRVALLPRGPSLAEVLCVRGRLGIAEAVDLVLGLCDTLAEAHAIELAVQSLGTDNLFQRGSGRAVHLELVDFGAPPRMTGSRGRYVAAGLRRACHLAPEQLEGTEGVDHRADIWALGTILYELLCGEPAFDGPSPTAILENIAAADPVPLGARRPEIPAALALAVHACLCREAWQRPRSVEDVKTMLRAFATEQPTGPQPRPVVPSAPSTLIGFRAPPALPASGQNALPAPRRLAEPIDATSPDHSAPLAWHVSGVRRSYIVAAGPELSSVQRDLTGTPAAPPLAAPIPATVVAARPSRREAWLLFGGGLLAAVASSAVAAAVLRGWSF